jgi:hypothetical protein
MGDAAVDPHDLVEPANRRLEVGERGGAVSRRSQGEPGPQLGAIGLLPLPPAVAVGAGPDDRLERLDRLRAVAAQERQLTVMRWRRISRSGSLEGAAIAIASEYTACATSGSSISAAREARSSSQSTRSATSCGCMVRYPAHAAVTRR